MGDVLVDKVEERILNEDRKTENTEQKHLNENTQKHDTELIKSIEDRDSEPNSNNDESEEKSEEIKSNDSKIDHAEVLAPVLFEDEESADAIKVSCFFEYYTEN